VSYSLLDSGNELKLEQFGRYRVQRPCAQALWSPQRPAELWARADALFTREPENRWVTRNALPSSWTVEHHGLAFKISPTEFGHMGLFPEHCLLWQEMERLIRQRSGQSRVLNLFAYSGGATCAAARAGAQVCHLDASKGMVSWARENAALNGLDGVPIRWIVDDVWKFVQRELRRGVRYEGILLDPPSFGRGSRGEVFKIERDLLPLLHACRELLSEVPLFFFLSAHTSGMTPLVMRQLLEQLMGSGAEAGELIIQGEGVCALPCGSYARWVP
jgi:23S rRNA (cytosine1962-C5)-methyltransferase